MQNKKTFHGGECGYFLELHIRDGHLSQNTYDEAFINTRHLLESGLLLYHLR